MKQSSDTEKEEDRPASGLKKIVFASRNKGKIKEIKEMLRDSGVSLLSLEDYPDLPEIPEDGNSFLENALRKARTIAELTGETVLADDSGLEVAALHGAPGIYSARYAGEEASDASNIRKLLNDLRDVPPSGRKARFMCVLILYRPDGSYQAFNGSWEGRIAEAPIGPNGFGYDPVFYLPGKGITVAELPAEVKNRISHRAKAVAKLKIWLEKEIHRKRGVAQPGSAPALGAGCRRFKSCRPDHDKMSDSAVQARERKVHDYA
jgi:XTP/dITP diphosphohydrolase